MNQLRRDLNVVVGRGNNWNIPFFWGPVLRYCSAPILAMVTSFAYPKFYANGRMDPLHIAGFTFAHCTVFLVIIGLILPRALDVFVLPEKRDDWKAQYAPQVKAVLLSNHGGRALDTAPPAVHTLLEIRKYCPEVFGKIELWVDGGIKRGTDVVKALCLGATGVGLGRPALFGLGAGGQAGVERVFESQYSLGLVDDVRLLTWCSLEGGDGDVRQVTGRQLRRPAGTAVCKCLP